MTVRELFNGSGSLSSTAKDVLPFHAIQAITQQSISLSNVGGKPYWTCTSNGEFSVSSAWAISRSSLPTMMSTKFIWHKLLPRHISVFMWRLFLRKLPIDEGLWCKGIQLASKYSCCSSMSMETFSHVFISSHAALSTWNFCQMVHRLAILGTSVQQRCTAVWFGSKSIVHTLFPSLVLWHLWKYRNHALFEGSILTASSIAASVQSDLHCILLTANFIGIKATAGAFSSYGKRKVISIQAVHWDRPSCGLVKLNTDGACKGNPGPSGGGGMTRGSNGEFIFAFANYYGDGTNTMADLRALFHGVHWIHSNGYRGALVEIDSKMIFYCLTKGHSPP